MESSSKSSGKQPCIQSMQLLLLETMGKMDTFVQAIRSQKVEIQELQDKIRQSGELLLRESKLTYIQTQEPPKSQFSRSTTSLPLQESNRQALASQQVEHLCQTPAYQSSSRWVYISNQPARKKMIECLKKSTEDMVEADIEQIQNRCQCAEKDHLYVQNLLEC